MNGLTECREQQDYNYLEKEDYYNIPEEIEVTVSITLSKTFTIPTEDLEVEDYGKGVLSSVTFTENSMKEYIRCNKAMPDQAFEYVPKRKPYELSTYEDLKDWNVDDFAVIQEEHC